jgi:hypothetical protein
MRHSCTFVQHYFQTDAFDVSMRKDACGIFGTNGLIFTLFVLQNVMPFCNKMFESGAGDRLGVDLGVLGETAWD